MDQIEFQGDLNLELERSEILVFPFSEYLLGDLYRDFTERLSAKMGVVT